MAAKHPIVRVLTGGPFHPSAAQFRDLSDWLGTPVRGFCHDGAEVFDHLDDCDLFVAAGLHWTGMGDGTAGWLAWPEGVAPVPYVTPGPDRRRAFEAYVASGRPVLGFHGGIACFDDWTEFGSLLGFRWDWKITSHTPVGEWKVDILPTGHPVVADAGSYSILDELYFNVQLAPGMPIEVHATAAYHDIRFPMVMTATGGRIAGAGKTAYLANGHSLESTACPGFRRVLAQTIHWLLS